MSRGVIMIRGTGRDEINVVLVGCGSMGAHHARTISAHPHTHLMGTMDILPERAACIAKKYHTKVLFDIPDQADAVVVATPTTTHQQVAQPLLERGLWAFIEKPLAHDSIAAQSLVRASPRLCVGHIERFNPAIRALGAISPRSIRARRLTMGSLRGLDVDVVLDLMVHDLDLVLNWGGEVQSFEARGLCFTGQRVDAAWVRLQMASGMEAELVASRVAHRVERIVEIREADRLTVLDLSAGEARRQGELLASVDGRDALAAQWGFFVDTMEGQKSQSQDQSLRNVVWAERISEAIRRR